MAATTKIVFDSDDLHCDCNAGFSVVGLMNGYSGAYWWNVKCNGCGRAITWDEHKEVGGQWYIDRCGEHANSSYCEIFETNLPAEDQGPNSIGPYPTREQAEKAVKQRGLTLTSLRDLKK